MLQSPPRRPGRTLPLCVHAEGGPIALGPALAGAGTAGRPVSQGPSGAPPGSKPERPNSWRRWASVQEGELAPWKVSLAEVGEELGAVRPQGAWGALLGGWRGGRSPVARLAQPSPVLERLGHVARPQSAVGVGGRREESAAPAPAVRCPRPWRSCRRILHAAWRSSNDE